MAYINNFYPLFWPCSVQLYMEGKSSQTLPQPFGNVWPARPQYFTDNNFVNSPCNDKSMCVNVDGYSVAIPSQHI